MVAGAVEILARDGGDRGGGSCGDRFPQWRGSCWCAGVVACRYADLFEIAFLGVAVTIVGRGQGVGGDRGCGWCGWSYSDAIDAIAFLGGAVEGCDRCAASHRWAGLVGAGWRSPFSKPTEKTIPM